MLAAILVIAHKRPADRSNRSADQRSLARPRVRHTANQGADSRPGHSLDNGLAEW